MTSVYCFVPLGAAAMEDDYSEMLFKLIKQKINLKVPECIISGDLILEQAIGLIIIDLEFDKSKILIKIISFKEFWV